MTDLGGILPSPKKVKLACGKELNLQPLTMLDIRDGEKILGPYGSWFPSEEGNVKEFSFRSLAVVLWLLARKHGASNKDQMEGNWPIKLEELERMVTLQDVLKLQEVILGFLT